MAIADPAPPGTWWHKLFGFLVSAKDKEAIRAQEQSKAREKEWSSGVKAKKAPTKPLQPPVAPPAPAERQEEVAVIPQPVVQQAPPGNMPVSQKSLHESFCLNLEPRLKNAALRTKFKPVHIEMESHHFMLAMVRLKGEQPGQEVCRFYFKPKYWTAKGVQPDEREIMIREFPKGTDWSQRHLLVDQLLESHHGAHTRLVRPTKWVDMLTG